MLAYDFILRAFAASGIVAVVAATVGYFLVLRGQAFAGHALAHIAFAGATGAALVGLPPLAGVLALTIAAGAAMGLIAERLSGRDVAIGIILALSLGFGLLFLSLTRSNAIQATSLLFGSVLAVAPGMLTGLALLGLLTLAALAAVGRPLLFSTLQPELAEARGVRPHIIGAAFLVIVALAVAQSIQIVGVLLVFTLMIGPPAAAQLVTTRLGAGIALAALLALVEAWAGIVVATWTNWPTSFWITAFSTAIYLAAALFRRRTG